MKEIEYVETYIAERLKKYEDKRIALYGSGENCRKVLQKCKAYNVVGLIDNNITGLHKYGKLVLSLNQVLELDVEIIVVAGQIAVLPTIYNRIIDFCMTHRILLVDMYGHELAEVSRKITAQKCNFFNLNSNVVERKIDEHDVISFHLENTLIMSSSMENSNMQTLDNTNTLVRQEMLFLYRYALTKGKDVYIVSDTVADKSEIEKLLILFGIENYRALILSGEWHVQRINGLYRELLRQCNSHSILHIGEDELKDGWAPMMYNIDICLIKSSRNMLLEASDYKLNLDNCKDKYRRFVIERFLSKVFDNPFALYGTEGRLKEENELVKHIIQIQQSSNTTKVESNELPDLILDVLPTNIEEMEKIEFTNHDTPKVSIIIPVYNQFEYTYNCLKAIKNNSGDVEYEVIIADDCSSDWMKDIDRIVSGACIIHNESNLKFILNCNNAVKYARGKYIVLLNNDTQVQSDWLQPMLDLLEKDASIGMVGAKLIYPDGLLQEAGGILWSDGSAWNYGRGQCADSAEYNYVRTTDYISGAAIMLSKELWGAVKGFDERFVPAYYEDADLAFEIRKRGLKVVYQPLSVVVHFEGISNGTDTMAGLKTYQVENGKQFYAKWKDELQKEHYPNGENVFLARDRSRAKKHILVIDHYVPNYDKDAGSRGTFMYLKTFIKMGFQVTFLGDNFAKMEPYATELNQLGIEVLYGVYYYHNWEQWLKDNLKYFEYVYLQRPHISVKYIDLIRKYGKAKIFYYAVDLCHIREYREYLLTNNPKTLESSEKWKKIEYELFEKADVGHVVGSYEQAEMQKVFPHKPIRNIPLYIYEETQKDIPKDFSRREDILFVGGFGHPPNCDAVLWFAKEVFPAILKEYPQIRWHIVGNQPPIEVQELASNNIIVEGFLTDSDLHNLYRKCRIAVVPLRYGAGIKGKVLEAAYFQLPLITTSIGAEGMEQNHGAFIIEDAAEEMSRVICDLYEDYSRLREMSDKAIDFIEKNFSLEVAEAVLKEDME